MPEPVRRLGLARPLGRDPEWTYSPYQSTPDQPFKTGHFYFAANRTFLLCVDSLFQDKLFGLGFDKNRLRFR
jgi:hypothetical protein